MIDVQMIQVAHISVLHKATNLVTQSRSVENDMLQKINRFRENYLQDELLHHKDSP